MKLAAGGANYRLGGLYSLVTSALLATQEPFSALAAKRLSSSYFICITQFALLLSVPLLIISATSRRDFAALLSNLRNLIKFAVLLAAGVSGLVLYNIGLSSAHPIITAAVLNLSPFWAALVASLISKKSIPVSASVFFGCFAVAFLGAMLVAWSQMPQSNELLMKDVLESIFHSRWAYAIPMPIFFALSGTLVREWFSEFDESAVIGANFVFSGVILVPVSLALARIHPSSLASETDRIAILLLLIGTLAAAAAGRVFYQVALSATDNDNGFVTMFFLSVPPLSALITVPLSWWFRDLRFAAGPMFFAGLILITIPLLVFLLKSWRHLGARTVSRSLILSD